MKHINLFHLLCPFESKFVNSKNSFSKLVIPPSCLNLKGSLLLMTATMSLLIVQKSERITGLSVNPENYMWATSSHISSQNIAVDVQFLMSQILPSLQNILKDVLGSNLTQK